MAVLDLFSLLVVNLFGSAILSILFILLVFFIFGILTRMGMLLITSICILYTMITMTFFFGGVIGVVIFLGVSIYFVTALLPWFSGLWNQ